jgi:small subunit ribosomal protein S9
MTEEPQQPEGETPEEESPEGTPSEAAPEAGADVTPQDEGEGAPASDAPGPEIEGLEELEQAEPAAEEAGEPEAEAPAADEPAADEPVAEAPAAEAAGEPAAEEPDAPAAEEAAEAPAAEAAEAPAAEAPRQRGGAREGGEKKEEVIPGAHLEPDLVLEEQRSGGAGEFGEYDQYADADGEAAAPEEGAPADEAADTAPVAHTPLELAADARYHATGKRKSAIARVILKPGEGSYTVNGRHLDEYFPRVRLQRMASQPLEAAGYQTRLDVVARIHGGGVSAQANALRHGIARALVEADPALRAELKGRGYLTRDPREKERKKAGLKKARKRPQFSKR